MASYIKGFYVVTVMPYKDKKKQAEYMKEYRTAYMREYRKRKKQQRLNLQAEIMKPNPDIKRIQENEVSILLISFFENCSGNQKDTPDSFIFSITDIACSLS